MSNINVNTHMRYLNGKWYTPTEYQILKIKAVPIPVIEISLAYDPPQGII